MLTIFVNCNASQSNRNAYRDIAFFSSKSLFSFNYEMNNSLNISAISLNTSILDSVFESGVDGMAELVIAPLSTLICLLLFFTLTQ